MDVREWLKNDILVFDGAIGTMLQQHGLKPGALPELFNLTDPETVTGIHREYVLAGADVITTNTFQAHELKLNGNHSVEEVVDAGVRCARKSGAQFVALDVGPLGQLFEPMGTMSFDRAYEIFSRQMTAGEKSGADLIIIETISDLYEAKAAILAAKENTSLPVFCTMTFQEDGRTFMGCDPLTATFALQGLSVDALGVNCSLGPQLLAPVVETMLKYSRIPVIVQANAGLPVMQGGKAVYETSPEQYASGVLAMIDKGVRVTGGCCGTTPEYIRLIKESLGGRRPVHTNPLRVSACTSGVQAVILDGVTTEIGERLNPTGKKELQEALRDGDIDYIIDEAMSQVDAGAKVLDINAGMPDIDESAVISEIIRELQQIIRAPLQIDSADPAVIEAGVRVYNGKPVINSVSGKAGSIEKIFPIVKKYGALVVVLTLDEDGIPETARGRLEIARRVRDKALSYGILEEDLLIDCLAPTASANQSQINETLAAIRLVKSELGLKTILGVSNVSFGLPDRAILNAAFLTAALGAGLDAAILDPISPRNREALGAYRVLNGEDKNAVGFIAKHTK